MSSDHLTPYRKGGPSPARVLALRLLGTLDDPRGIDMDAILHDARAAGVEGRDIALAREIAFGVCRNLPWLEEVLGRFMKHPLPDTARQVHDALLIGAYQLLHLDRVPAHSAVDETVRLVASVSRSPGHRKLANAILRRVSSVPRESLRPPADAPPALRFAVPQWLVDEAAKVLPPSEVSPFLEAGNSPAPLVLRRTEAPGAPSTEALAEAIAAHAPDPVPGWLPGSWHIPGGVPPESIEPFREGWLTVEDEGAQAAGLLCAPQPRTRILDLCASPGGKTAHLADLAARKLQRLLATDVSPAKLERLQDTLDRLGLAGMVETGLAEELEGLAAPGEFDLVLVDAPCSGLGTLRRHPEIRWRRLPADRGRLARRQLELLQRAARFVRPGGALVYSVCTFTVDETDGVADRFLAEARGEFAPDPQVPNLEPRLEALATGPGRWRTWPHRQGADAFFVARFRRQTAF